MSRRRGSCARHLRGAWPAVALLAVAGCTTGQPEPTPLPALVTTTQSANKSDTAYMQLANENGLLAESLGRDVASFGASACVRSFAARSLATHEANRIVLTKVADAASVTVSDTLSKQDTIWLRDVARERGANADRAYLHALQVSDEALRQQSAIEAAGSPVPGLQAFARTTETDLDGELRALSSPRLMCGGR